MSNTSFMDLTNRLLRRLNEVEISSSSDFSSTKGIQSVAKDLINSSIQDIMHREFEWPFNATTGSQVLTAGTEEYSFPSDLKSVKWDSFLVQKDASLSEYGHYLDYISRDYYTEYMKSDDEYAGATGKSSPRFVFKGHGNGFGVSPSPDKAYTVLYEYFLKSDRLSDYDDTSTIPTEFDEVIIQRALQGFYMFRDNREEAQDAKLEFKEMLEDMTNIYLGKDVRMRSHLIVHPRTIGRTAETDG